MQTAIRAGYATAGSDTGHTGGNGSFAIGHPEQVIDFGYRAIHEMAVQSKSLIKAFYGESEKLSYFVGCSTGGRQALMEAQRYPNDFDGIIAGAPANDHINLHAGDMSRQVDIFKDPAGFLNANKVTMLADAVMKACDELDGVKDGILNDPRQCKFDPASLLCKEGDSDSCLTAAQVKTVQTGLRSGKNIKRRTAVPRIFERRANPLIPFFVETCPHALLLRAPTGTPQHHWLRQFLRRLVMTRSDTSPTRTQTGIGTTSISTWIPRWR